MKTIEITPNYAAIFARFSERTRHALENLSKKQTPTRADMYEFISMFRIALSAATSETDIMALRSMFDERANAMSERINQDREEAENADTY